MALEDVMTAHLSALARAAALRCAIFTISAPTPFSPADSPELGSRAEAAILRHFPHAADMYRSLGWTLPQRLSKVYITDKAISELGWQPRWTFLTLISDPDRRESAIRGAL